MSVFGITNYLLVTQKGQTRIPFVRGTGFLLDFEKHGFHTKHVISAGHVSMPLRYASIYGRPPLFSRIGERHLTPKILLFDGFGKRKAILPLEYDMKQLKGTCVAALRVRGERELFPRMAQDGVPLPIPYELEDLVSGKPLGENEELILQGLCLDQDVEAADVAVMKPLSIPANAKLSFISELFGSVVIVSTGKQKVSPGMSGCPVLRKSTGKCVGMLICAAKTKLSNPELHTNKSPLLNANNNSSEDPRAKQEEAERKKKVSIFNEERLPRRVSDDTAMALAVKEFEEAHRQMEPPMLDLVGQDGTLEELNIRDAGGFADDEKDEQFAAFVHVKDFINPLRYSEVV